MLTADEFERLSFAARLRLALSLAGVPVEIPESCTGLLAYAADLEIQDGPAAPVLVRNRLVHPSKKKRTWPDSAVMVEAWQLSLEYLVLLILSLLKYNARYVPQWVQGYPGSEVPVRWTAPS